MATIWDDLKQYWQLAGVPLAKRSKVNIVDRQTNGQVAPIAMTDGPNRVDLTLPETSPLYIFSTVAAPFTATGGDLWLTPYGQLFDNNAILIPIGRKQILSELTFHILTTPLASDSVQIDVCRAPVNTTGASPTGLTLTIPSTVLPQDFVLATPFPVVFNVGDSLALRLRQSGTQSQAGWNAYICVG